MTKNLDIIIAAVSLIIKAALLAATFSGRVRRRSLKRLAAMDADAKDKEIIFLRDKVDQLRMQVSILEKRIKTKEKNVGQGALKKYHRRLAYFLQDVLAATLLNNLKLENPTG